MISNQQLIDASGWCFTLPETNIAPENCGFQKEPPFLGVFSGAMLVLGRGSEVEKKGMLKATKMKKNIQPISTWNNISTFSVFLFVFHVYLIAKTCF